MPIIGKLFPLRARAPRAARNSCRLAVALALAGCALPAAAADGPYAGFGGGFNYPRNQDLGNGQGTVRYDDGSIGTLSFGYAIGNLRPELELGLRENHADHPSSLATGEPTSEADAVMANLWYDLPAPAMAPRLRPFIGFGAGSADVDINGVVGADGIRRTGSESVFAYHGGAGIGYDVTPRLALSLAYRYFQTELEHYTAGGDSSRYRSDAALLGLRYAFGTPARPQVRVEAKQPEVVAVVPRQQAEVAAFETVVLRGVNFQFDEAELTPPARATLDELASRLQQHQDVAVIVEGHTDAFGTDEYNRELGRKRAEAVRQYLVGRGLPADGIEVVSRGESEPAASNATEEGRAQNRRTELQPRSEPRNVRIVVEAPSEESVDAAREGDPGGKPQE